MSAERSRYDRNCGVRGCDNRARHEHTGPLVEGEEVVCVVKRPEAPVVCFQNAMGYVLGITPVSIGVEIVDGRVVLLQPGDVVRARGWTPPHTRRDATPAVRKEAVTDGTELTIDDALEGT